MEEASVAHEQKLMRQAQAYKKQGKLKQARTQHRSAASHASAS